MGPRPQVCGVDMLRNSWCASVGAELSNTSAAWTSDSRGSLLRTKLFSSMGSLDCVSVITSKQTFPGLARHIRGPIFVYHYPRVHAHVNNRSLEGGWEVQRTCIPSEFAGPE